MAGTETIPLEAFDSWQCVADNNYIIGDFVWTSMDYLGESGIGRMHFDPDRKTFLGDYPWHQAYCGDIDLAGFKRPQSYYRDVIWGWGDPLYIAVHYPIPEGKTPVITYWGWPDVDANWNWSGCEEKTFKVDVYSRAAQVELFLNGKSLGVKPTTPAEKHQASFEAPYTPGELKAVGTMPDGQIVEKVLETTGAPAAIRLTPDRTAIPADRFSLSYIIIEVVDAAGRLVPYADHEILFTVQGEGELAAVGSGNPTSAERYRGNKRKAFRGRCVAVAQSTGQPGEILLRAEGNGLQSAEVRIRVS